MQLMKLGLIDFTASNTNFLIFSERVNKITLTEECFISAAEQYMRESRIDTTPAIKIDNRFTQFLASSINR